MGSFQDRGESESEVRGPQSEGGKDGCQVAGAGHGIGELGGRIPDSRFKILEAVSGRQHSHWRGRIE